MLCGIYVWSAFLSCHYQMLLCVYMYIVWPLNKRAPWCIQPLPLLEIVLY